MKCFVASILAVIGLSVAADAKAPAVAPTADPVAAATTASPAANKNKTNMSFDDLLIQGKYHFSDEAVITVEQDKALDGLLGVRKDFKDRLAQSAGRN